MAKGKASKTAGKPKPKTKSKAKATPGEADALAGNLVERDLVNDVEPRKCSCSRTVVSKHKRGLAPICPLERSCKYELYDHLYSYPVPAPSLVRAQVQRCVHQSKKNDHPVRFGLKVDGVPVTDMVASDCIATLDKYLALLDRHKAFGHHPKLALVYSRIAALYLALGDIPDASEYATIATELDPYHAASWFQAAQAKSLEGDILGANELLLRGSQFNPGCTRLQAALVYLQKSASTVELNREQ
mmetsp:Transcript_2804/g.5424  ORF Transcript_2804/g.5424 Transcript_2804/m.5424 type:complete len:244 (+) Transcript_2804:74-805(+)